MTPQWLPPTVDEKDAPKFHCLDCRDEPNGWRIFLCPGVPVEASKRREQSDVPIYPCSRLLRHPGHSYAERCECLPTNPNIAKAKERARLPRIASKRHHEAAR